MGEKVRGAIEQLALSLFKSPMVFILFAPKFEDSRANTKRVNTPELQFLFPIKNPPERCHFTLSPISVETQRTNPLEKACFLSRNESSHRGRECFLKTDSMSIVKPLTTAFFKVEDKTTGTYLLLVDDRLISIHCWTLC